MPNRIIKESICMSDSVDKLSWFEEVLFYRLIVNCDDFGRYDGRASIIKNRLFPLKDNKLNVSEVQKAIINLAKAELVVLYEVDGRQYLYLPTWERHQTIRAQKSKYPSPPADSLKTSESICKQMQANVSVIQSNPIQSYSYSESEKKRFTPPTLEDVQAYVAEKGYNVDAEYFFKYYTEGGWKDSKGNPVKNWKQKLITWAKKDESKPKKFTTAADYKPASKIDMGLLDKIKIAGL